MPQPFCQPKSGSGTRSSCVPCRTCTRRHRDVQIEVAVVVIIYERDAHTSFFPADSHFFRYIFKLSLTLVAQQLHAVAQAYRKIGLPVIVKIARSAAESAARKTNARRLRYILKSPVAQVAQQMARPIRRAVHEKEIRLAIAVKVKKTRARACSDGHRDSTAAF